MAPVGFWRVSNVTCRFRDHAIASTGGYVRNRESWKETAFDNFDLKAEASEAQVPTIRFAFHFPELLALFRAIDTEANDARDRNRSRGTLGIGLVSVALLYAAATPRLHGGHDSLSIRILGVVAAALGLIGTMVGLFGLSNTSQRRRWLVARWKTEMLRLFHFQYIAARVPEIEAAAQRPDLQSAYEAGRKVALDCLLTTMAMTVDDSLGKAIEPGAPEPFGFIEKQLVTGRVSSATNDLFAAWLAVRVEWQLGYCKAKLARRSTKHKLSPRQQEDAFSLITWVCIVIVTLAHFAFVAGQLVPVTMSWLETVVIWTALIALSIRALEDGLRPQREVERYEHYRANILVSKLRFLAAPDVQTKLEIMRYFEQVSLEEMRTFLRTHANARFLL
jgi:hypothetical protein